ncbi:MAG: hypothetical protein RIC93_13225 [Alphaproteobacteria bacterium]
MPGQPKIVIRNIPGSGQVPGTNHFAQYAKTDGLMMIATGTPAIMNQILGHKAVKFDIDLDG